jgi:alpha-N-arabinofuranosidase
MKQAEHSTPLFECFTYVGNDERYKVPFDAATQYLNPVISGTNPDPSVCRQGNDFYMANSSFVYWPGIPIWHSRDLVDWDFCGYVLNQNAQISFKEGLRITGGVYAPDIKYCERNQTFYLIVTLVDHMGNVVFKTRDPYQGWSEPIPVPEVHGIDPSFLFDQDGKCYIVNNDEPAYPAEYDGHRAIWAREYDLNTDKVCGDPIVLVDKGIRPEEKPIWIEGPHLYHFANELNGRLYDQYYLMCAEGGTSEGHSEVVLTGKSALGKFAPCTQNPILTQRSLAPLRPNPTSCTGHADLVQVGSSSLNNNARNGEWWSVFLGCTAYDGAHLYNTGRSTFLLPVSWQKDAANDGIQPFILSPDSVIPTVCSKSPWQQNVYNQTEGDKAGRIGNSGDPKNLLTGNGQYTDNFEGNSLYPLWFTLRTPYKEELDNRIADWYEHSNPGLTLQGKPVKLSQKGQPCLLCRWVKNNTYTVSTRMRYTPQEPQSMAGLTLFQTEAAYYLLVKRLTDSGKSEIALLKTDIKHHEQLIASYEIKKKDENLAPVDLRAEVNQHEVSFSFSFDQGQHWQTLGDTQDADILTTHYADGFTGSVAGIYAYKK